MPSVLGCSQSGSRYGNVPNELIHRAGPPFLDNHYRGYQYTQYLVVTIIISFLVKLARQLFQDGSLRTLTSYVTGGGLINPGTLAHNSTDETSLEVGFLSFLRLIGTIYFKKYC